MALGAGAGGADKSLALIAEGYSDELLGRPRILEVGELGKPQRCLTTLVRAFRYLVDRFPSEPACIWLRGSSVV